MDEWAHDYISIMLAESHLEYEEYEDKWQIHDHVPKTDYTVEVSVTNELVNFRSRLSGPIVGSQKNVGAFAKDLLQRNTVSTLVSFGLAPSGSIIAKSSFPTYELQDRLFFDTLAGFEHVHEHTLPEIIADAGQHKVRLSFDHTE